MGPETLIPLMVAGAGTYMQMEAADEQADDRRSILNQQLERDEGATKKAIGLVQQEGQQYDQQTRMDALKKQEEKTYGTIENDIQGAGGAQVATSGDAGNVSEDFLKTKATRAVSEGSRLTAIAREAAKSRAPGQVQSNDALRRAGMAGELQNTWGTNRNMGRATGLDADAVEMPGYGALGSLASAAGTAMAGSAAGKYAGTSTNPLAANYENSFDRMNTSGINWRK